jgi:hypothetical protein
VLDALDDGRRQPRFVPPEKGVGVQEEVQLSPRRGRSARQEAEHRSRV